MWSPPVTPPLYPEGTPRKVGRYRVTYGFDHPRSYGPHGALDIGNGLLGGPVLAASDGTVLAVGNLLQPWSEPGPFPSGNYGGLMVVLDHPGGLRSVYAHLADAFVLRGQRVSRGDRLGLIGDSGSARGQGHLHFEIIGPTGRIDPWPIITEEIAVRLRHVYEPWTLPIGAKVYLDGPGTGGELTVTAAERFITFLEATDGSGWRVGVLEDGRVVWTRYAASNAKTIRPRRRGGMPWYDQAVKATAELGRRL
jgi:murein DD-endopeptidase MepM/ murein hydrolase activator NlpD